MKVCFTLLFCLLYFTPCSAQDAMGDLRAKYDTATIRQIGSNKFLLKNKKLRRKELKALLNKYPESALVYKSFLKKNRITTAMMFTSVAAYLTGFILLPGEHREIAGPLVIGGALLSFVTIPVANDAQYDLHLAVWLYNRAVLTGSARTPAR